MTAAERRLQRARHGPGPTASPRVHSDIPWVRVLTEGGTGEGIARGSVNPWNEKRAGSVFALLLPICSLPGTKEASLVAER